MKADNSFLFPLDFMAVSIFNRSMSLIAGFILLVRQENFICVAPLVRLQLDNALRFFATALVKDPHKVTVEFIGGTPIKDFTDEQTGKNLTDTYLVNKLSGLDEKFKWVKPLYQNSSGYIHLSEKHFIISTTTKDNEPMKFASAVSAKDNFITTEDRVDAVNVMIETSKVVLFLLDSWSFNKYNPGLREKLAKTQP